MNAEVHIHASSRIMNAAVSFGSIIILIVYLPIFSLQGIEGKDVQAHGPDGFVCHSGRLHPFLLTYILMMRCAVHQQTDIA